MEVEVSGVDLVFMSFCRHTFVFPLCDKRKETLFVCMDPVDPTSRRETGVLLVPVPSPLRVPSLLMQRTQQEKGVIKFIRLPFSR